MTFMLSCAVLCRKVKLSSQLSGVYGKRYFNVQNNNHRLPLFNIRPAYPGKLLFSRNKTSQNVTVRSKDKFTDFKRLFSLAKPDSLRITGSLMLLIVSSLVTLTVPFAIGKVINVIYDDKSKQDMTERLEYMSKILLTVFILGALANFGRYYLMQTSAQRIIHRMRYNLYSSIMRQDIQFFDKSRTGELINRLSADTQLIGNTVTMNISDGLRSIVQAIGATGMMIYTSPQLTAISLSIVPPIVGLSVIYGKYVKRLSKKKQDELANATQIAEERLGNIRTVRAFAKEQLEISQYTNAINKVLNISYKESLATGCFWGFTGFSGNFLILSIFYYGGMMMQTSAISVGDLTSFLLYAAYSGISLSGLTSFYTTLMQGIGASERIWELTDKQPLIPCNEGLIPKETCAYDISFENVEFRYPMRPENNVLKNFNLHVPSGKTLAVVGGSGSGKSTIISLLLRFYNVPCGNIMIGGHNISTLNPSWIRDNVGLVSQEPVLFSTSIKNNILYGALNADQDDIVTSNITSSEIEKVCKIANVENFVNSFPDKLETIVGEKGVMLSGGQKQRIAIARAVLKDPKILILDEATSALDAESEFLVQEALDRVLVNRTCIIIAHRLSTIRKADNIAVLNNGLIAESGSYEELMKNENGYFKQLVNRQQTLFG